MQPGRDLHLPQDVEQHASQANQEHEGEPDAPYVTLLPRDGPNVPVGGCPRAVEAAGRPRPALPVQARDLLRSSIAPHLGSSTATRQIASTIWEYHICCVLARTFACGSVKDATENDQREDSGLRSLLRTAGSGHFSAGMLGKNSARPTTERAHRVAATRYMPPACSWSKSTPKRFEPATLPRPNVAPLKSVWPVERRYAGTRRSMK